MNLISLKKAGGKARAAIKGINNLRIKKRGFYPSMLDRLSILIKIAVQEVSVSFDCLFSYV